MARSHDAVDQYEMVRYLKKVYSKGQMALSSEDMPEGKQKLTWGKCSGLMFQEVFRQKPGYIKWVLAHMRLTDQKVGSNQEKFVRFVYSRIQEMQTMQDRQASPLRQVPEAEVPEDKESNLKAEVQELKAQVTLLRQRMTIQEIYMSSVVESHEEVVNKVNEIF